MSRLLLVLFAMAGSGTWSLAGDESSLKYSSPNGRFALRITESNDEGSDEPKIELVEASSGKVMINLGTAYQSHLDDTVLVWSADSKWVAYGTRGNKEGGTNVYFWNGSAFNEIALPRNMPDPKIAFEKGAEAQLKNYGRAVKPLRFLKSGDLELANDLTLLSQVNDRTYKGVVQFTIAFDAKHRASVHRVGNSKTQIEE